MLTKDIGNVGELITAARFIKLGCSVFTSLADNSEIDYIIEHNGVLKKIQVKTTEKINDGKWNGNYQKVE